MGNQKQHGLHVTNTAEGEKDCLFIFKVSLIKNNVFGGGLIPFLFILFVYFEDFTTAECERVKKSDSWLRKNQSNEYKKEKNYGAFKLNPKAPIGVCIVLFFITFQ